MEKVHVFSIMWNEEFMLPYFLRHYSTFADRIFVINDHSTDKTVAVAKKNKKVTVLPFNYDGGLNEDNFNECFVKYYNKHSRGKADWVMCVDADEFVYHPQILSQLQKLKEKNIKLVRTTGYTIISKRLPKRKGQIYEEGAFGLRTREYDKPVVFDPELDIEFTHGRHDVRPSSKIRPQRGKLTLLHYKYLSKKYFLDRFRGTFSRTPILFRFKKYRLKKGLEYYHQALKSNLHKVI